MTNSYNPFDPRRNPRAGRSSPSPYSGQSLPTLEDYQELAKAYQELVQAYQELTARYDEQAKATKEKALETQIKDEVLKRQSDDIKRLETELLWVKAAVQQQAAQAEPIEKQEEDWQARYQQLQSEIDGLRRRWEQRYTTSVNEARNQILLDMLPLADHLDLALQHVTETNAEPLQGYVSNIETTRRAFLETLRRYGVERLDVFGQPFDPNLHEAVGHIAQPELPANHIAQVLQAGYRDGERLLRPARVLVTQ